MSRLSTIYRTGTQSNRRLHQLTQQDVFPLLDVKEITICLQSCDFIATEELVSKPTSQFIRSLFEQFLDTFMGLPIEALSNKVRGLNQQNDLKNGTTNGSNGNADVTGNQNEAVAHNGDGNGDRNVASNANSNVVVLNGDYGHENGSSQNDNEEDEDDTVEALNLIGLHRAAYKFFQGCGIYDLTIMDIVRPDPFKTRRILSAVVNYARFREEHSAECEQLVMESEASLEKIRQLQSDNDRVVSQIQGIKRRIEDDPSSSEKKATLKQVNSYNLKVESELKKLKKAQEIVTLEHMQYKEEKARLIEKLDDVQYLVFESSKEVDRLKAYSETDLTILQKIISDLKSQLSELQNAYNELDQRDKNLSVTIDSIQTVENELKNLFRILEEISNDISKEREASAKLSDGQEFLDQLNLRTNDLVRSIQQVQRQLNNMQEKTDKLRAQADERISKSQQMLTKYRQDYTKLVEERNLKEEEYNKKKELISEIETSISKKQLDYQMEVRNTELKAARLNAHIKLYLDEVGKKILN
ncbi:hypothetical protein G9P44_002301 [Scheffersomyces stipitis]|nr:hypothetical protein G9P44_002301 [Scheffersomyces stipitis]